ncbi:uncharacterized protein ARMOST_13599 [Armillaria ostoyae]|uniref:Nephrocystin 3-like N-terminal domain-containing protein n=1 Tax=Armillaria ostoyae TaxID=47428 RepID=A0A284RNC5_ARMOS|nr:uncharacterized protein ARMOST_13599 [Armillaria ostoyae]
MVDIPASNTELATLLQKIEEGLKAGSSWWRRILRRLRWPFTKADIEEDLKKIKHFKTLFMIAGRHNHLALSCAIKNTLGDVKDKIDEIHETQKIKKIAAWLTSLDYIALKALDSGSLSPGVGKTVLASIIVDYLWLLSMDRKKKTLVLSVFCDYESAVKQIIENVPRTLWKQLIQERGLSSLIISLYNNRTPLLLDTLTKYFSQAPSSFCRVYIILDALDEFPDNDGGREKLIKPLWKLHANTSLLVMTRDIFTIGSLFKADTRLDIRTADEDISLYIVSKLSCGRLARLVEGQDDLLQAILGVVTATADGMFYLGFLCMESLAQTTNSMANAYDTTMEKINSQGVYEKDLAYQLRHALAVEPGRKTLDPDNLCDEELFGTVCAGFVVMDSTYTEFGYLQGRGPIVRFNLRCRSILSLDGSQIFSFVTSIARTCLSYMSFTNLDLPRLYSPNIALLPFDFLTSPDVLSTKYPFVNYSCSCWGYHACGTVQYSLEKEIIAFLSDAKHREVADILRAAHRLRASHAPCMKGPPSPLQCTVCEGLVHIMEVLLNHRGADPYEEVPLLAAVETGHLGMAELLLSREDVDVNQADPNRFHATPLMEAAGNGHEEVLKASDANLEP